MQHIFLIFLGGGLGAVSRHWVGVFALRQFGPGFPWGTMAVNVAGSLAMGLLIGWLARRGASNDVRLFATTGFLGGFTTFSAFSLDFANLWREGETLEAFSYVAASVGLSLMAVFVGLFLMRQIQV